MGKVKEQVKKPGIGWKSLAEYSQQSERALYRLRIELKDAKVIDYIMNGKPPRWRMRWYPDRFDLFQPKKEKK